VTISIGVIPRSGLVRIFAVREVAAAKISHRRIRELLFLKEIIFHAVLKKIECSFFLLRQLFLYRIETAAALRRGVTGWSDGFFSTGVKKNN
jgi:hypothetical protein